VIAVVLFLACSTVEPPAPGPCRDGGILPDAAVYFECPAATQIAVDHSEAGPAFLCLCPAMDEIDEAVVVLEAEVGP
jgi:hypothetical protein